MWIYLGIFTTTIALIINLHNKLKIKSQLQNRKTTLIPVTHLAYKYDWDPATDKHPSCGHIEVPCKTTFQFSARYETSYDALAKEIGISHEFETGIKSFDEKIYLASITEEDATKLGENQEIANLITTVLEPDINHGQEHLKNELICDGLTLYLKILYKKDDKFDSNYFISSKLKPLNILANQLANYRPPSEHFWKVPSQRNTAIILAISSTFGILGGLELIRFLGLGQNQLFHPLNLLPLSLALSTIGFLALLIAALSLIKKSARRHLVILELCITGFGGLLLSSYGWLYDLNISADSSNPIIENYKVTDKLIRTHHTKRASYKTYHLQIANSAEPIGSEIRIGSSLYYKIQAQEFVSIILRKGFLNQAWMQDVRICNSCKDSSDNAF